MNTFHVVLVTSATLSKLLCDFILSKHLPVQSQSQWRYSGVKFEHISQHNSVTNIIHRSVIPALLKIYDVVFLWKYGPKHTWKTYIIWELPPTFSVKFTCYEKTSLFSNLILDVTFQLLLVKKINSSDHKKYIDNLKDSQDVRWWNRKQPAEVLCKKNLQACNFIKETSTQVFSCEICKI